MLLAEDIAGLARALADVIRILDLLRNTARAALDNARSAHFAIALRGMVGPFEAPNPKKCDFFEVDFPAVLERRPSLSNAGALPAFGYGELLVRRAARGSQCIAPLPPPFALGPHRDPVEFRRGLT